MTKAQVMILCAVLFIAIQFPVRGAERMNEPAHLFNELDYSINEITLRLDGSKTANPSDIAQRYVFLLDDYTHINLGNGFYVFGLASEYGYDDVHNILNNDDDILMVNPGVVSESGKRIYMTNKIIAKFTEGTISDYADSLIAFHSLTKLKTIGDSDEYYILSHDDQSDYSIVQICSAFTIEEALKYAYPNFIYVDAYAGNPSDPLFIHQCHHHNTGQQNGTVDCDIDMPEAWDIMPDSIEKEEVIICIIDSGFDMYHPDLPSSIFTWPYDVVGPLLSSPSPDGDPSNDCNGSATACVHGTMVMGMIVSAIDNQAGVAGIVSNNIKVMPIKLSDAFGRFDSECVINAFYYARTRIHKPDVYSCSWGDLSLYDQGINDELTWCYENGKPVVFAAGNSGVVEYPAYLPTVLAVGATNNRDEVPYWSARDSALDLTAPGDSIWTMDLSDSYGSNPQIDTCSGSMDYICNCSGTSFAAPIVAGIIAKMLAIRPDIIHPDSTAEQIYEALRITADDLGSAGYDTLYGWGRVNANRAMVAVCRGDANNDQVIDISDAVWIINYVFNYGPAPIPYICMGDTNCDGGTNVSDAVIVINFVQQDGPPPLICFENLP